MPEEAVPRIVTHQTMGAEHKEPPVRIKTHKVCSFVVFGNQFGHKNGVGMGTGDATEPPEKVAKGARPGAGTEGLRRQYHGRGPQWDGSIALSQVVEGEGERRQRPEASRGHTGGSTLSVSEHAFHLYTRAHVRSDSSRQERAATEPGHRHKGVDRLPSWGGVGGDSWLGPGSSLLGAWGRPRVHYT